MADNNNPKMAQTGKPNPVQSKPNVAAAKPAAKPAAKKEKKTFMQKLYGDIMPVFYGLGASVVIVGAMFKLNGWPGATQMLVIGLGVEALIFAFSAFEPKATDYTKLLYEGSGASNGKAKDDEIEFGRLLKEGAMKKEDIENLKTGFNSLATNARELSNMSSASVATNEYAQNAKSAASSLAKIGQSTEAAAGAFSEVAATVKSTGTNQGNLKQASEQYYGELNKATEGLKAMTAMYKSEFADSDSVKKYFEAYMKNMETAIEGATKSSAEMKKFQSQLTELNTNVGALNRVYGSMLTAMKQVNQG